MTVAVDRHARMMTGNEQTRRRREDTLTIDGLLGKSRIDRMTWLLRTYDSDRILGEMTPSEHTELFWCMDDGLMIGAPHEKIFIGCTRKDPLFAYDYPTGEWDRMTQKEFI